MRRARPLAKASPSRSSPRPPPVRPPVAAEPPAAARDRTRWRRDAAPRLDWLRRPEPVRTERRRRVGDSQERVAALGESAAQLAVHRLDHCIHAHQRSAIRNVAEESKVPDISVRTEPKPFRCTACGARLNPCARSPRSRMLASGILGRSIGRSGVRCGRCVWRWVSLVASSGTARGGRRCCAAAGGVTDPVGG